MDRRDFMKLAGAAGLALAAPLPGGRARAQETSPEPTEEAAPYDGPLWIFVGASGGWDPTYFCDPKGYQSAEEENPMNRAFDSANIGMAGNIPFAPVGYYAQFVQKHYERMLVVNGIDTQTNGHDSGRRHIGSGKLQEGFPAFGALVAAHHGQGLPMAFLTNGFYDDTAGTTARTRVGNLYAFERIARPNLHWASDPESAKFHTDETMARIQQAQQSRLEALRSQQRLPKMERAMGTLHLARSSDNTLSKLLEFLPEERPYDSLQRQAQLAISAYKAGACASATLSMGGFDTHGNHDSRHLQRLDLLFQGVDYIWDEADRQGVADRIVVVIGSDFGRTPGYNDNHGKDHWSVTSMILMGQGIPGNRLIGGTTERHGLKSVDPATLAPVDSGGVRLHPGHVHRALRKLAGIDASPVVAPFPLDVDEDLPLLDG